MAVKDWTDGNVVYAADFDEVVTSTVMRFPDAATRDATLVGDLAPKQGMMCHLQDVRRTQIYHIVSGTGYWCPLPGTVVAKITRTAALAVPTAATKVQWDTASLDILGGWSAAANTRYTAKVPGRYVFSGGIGYQLDGTGTFRIASLYYQGALVNEGVIVAVPASGASTQIPIRTTSLYMSANEYVEVMTQHNATAAIDISARSNLEVTYGGIGS